MDLHTVTSWRSPRRRDELDLGPGERFVAGGTWLFSQPQVETTGLVDLTSLEWQPWTVTDAGLSIAGTCTIADLVQIPHQQRLLRDCAEAFLMSFKIWNTATVGGNIAMALPAGAMISLTAGLGADAVVWGPGGAERREPVADLVRDVLQTSLAPGEVIRSIEIPLTALTARTACRKTALTSIGRSAAVVVGRAEAEATILTVTAATTRPVVLRFPVPPSERELDDALSGIDCWYTDPHGPADWRAAITRTLCHEITQELT